MALNNVPLSGQTLGQTRTAVNQNFSLIDTAFQVDHVDYNDPNQGQHDKVTLLPQGGAPSFAAGSDGIYCLPYNNGTTTLNEVFVHKQTNASTQDIPFTASILSSTSPANNIAGWTYLPSGLQLQWKTVSVVAGVNTITLSGFPGYTNIFSVIISAVGAPGPTVSLDSIISNTQFSIY